MADNGGRWPDITGDGVIVIGIAGGSGSGKTTVANAVVAATGADSVSFLEHDAYYRDRPDLSLEERAKVNYDHPDAFETELMVEHLEKLRAGQAVAKPVYDFAEYRRTADTVPVHPAAVIVVEGILVLAEPELRELMDLKIYVDTDADIRLVRRVRRDVEERGRSVDSVLDQYLATVRPMHLQFVEDSKRHADLILPEGYNQPAVGTVMAMIREFLRGL